MPFIRLNRINKGGAILLNSEHIVSVETESRTTTVTLAEGQLFSVEESPEVIFGIIEEIETSRITNAINASRLVVKEIV